MSHVWKATIAAQKEYEMIWSVGLRGLNDYAYPNWSVQCSAVQPAATRVQLLEYECSAARVQRSESGRGAV